MVDPLKAIEIFNAQGTTRQLATLYCISTGEIARIKGGIHPYECIIANYKYQNLTRLITGGFGYDKHFKQFKAFKLF